MLFHHAWLSLVLYIASVSANLPPVPGHPVYYNSTRLSAPLNGPTYAPSASGHGTVFRRGLTEASASSASISSLHHTIFTNSVSPSSTGKRSFSLSGVKPSYLPTGTGASTAATGRPTYVSSTMKRTILSAGSIYAKRALPSSTYKIASTEMLLSSVTRTRLSTGYTYSRSFTGTMSTSTSTALPKSSSINRSRLSTGYTYSEPSRSPSRPSTGPTSISSSLPASTAILTSSLTSRNATSSTTRSAISSTSPSAMPSTFKLQIFVIANDIGSPNVDGSYVSLHSDEKGQDGLRIVSDTAEASIFTLSPEGLLQSGDESAGIYAGTSHGKLLMRTKDGDPGGFVKSACHNSGGVLTCATANNVAFFTCDPAPARFVEVGPSGRSDNAGCVEFLMLVVWGR